jgi:hypothetical protein
VESLRIQKTRNVILSLSSRNHTFSRSRFAHKSLSKTKMWNVVIVALASHADSVICSLDWPEQKSECCRMHP